MQAKEDKCSAEIQRAQERRPGIDIHPSCSIQLQLIMIFHVCIVVSLPASSVAHMNSQALQ